MTNQENRRRNYEEYKSAMNNDLNRENTLTFEEWQAEAPWDGVNVDARPTHRETPYTRTRNAVYATGNRWAIENFNATH